MKTEALFDNKQSPS